MNTPLPIERDLQDERVSALVRLSEALEEALRELAGFEQRLASLAPADRGRHASRLRELRRSAERHLWYLIVQREAVGLSNHDDLYRVYRVPPGLVPSYWPP